LAGMRRIATGRGGFSLDMSNARFPETLMPLFQPSRYKVAYGGRGGGKSWGIATYLLLEAARTPLRILCCREFQSSIRESVHRLLSDLIEQHGLGDRFVIMEKGITGTNGSEFLFEGLRHNTGKIRSLEGIDKVWVEEASNVTKASWEILIPTIRKDGSEIIVSFNPELDTDETYQRFVADPPAGATLIKINYSHNPWFPEVLRNEMLQLRERDPDAYSHVYLGECRMSLDGAIYARELREAVEEGRISQVPYDPTRPVNVYFDLGWADMTAIWFVQHIAGETRLIDYHEDSLQAFGHYMKTLQAKRYVYGTMWLPHDAGAKSLGTGRSIEELARAAGWRVRLVPRLSVADGINAVRTLFPTIWFDREKTADGVQALRHYCYDVDPSTGQFGRTPRHDMASHGADALRYVCVAMQEARRAAYPTKLPKRPAMLVRRGRGPTGWVRI
jgi:phage terminase large subunit